ncbi:MAG: hypothetical protein ACFCGT_26320 [Sandaracinaceae bacterium]
MPRNPTRAQAHADARWVELMHEAHDEGLGRGLSRDTTLELGWTLVHGIAIRAVTGEAPRRPSTAKLIDAALDLLQRPR